ncbi:MAG: TldD/PmbA family protein, partial [Thermoprotei archaeon]
MQLLCGDCTLQVDLLEKAVDEGLKLGADYVEARYQLNRGRRIAYRNGELLGIEVRVREGVGVRVLVDGSLAFVAVSGADPEKVSDAVRRAVALARASRGLLKLRYGISDERLGRARYSVYARKRFDDVDIEEKLEALKSLWSAAQSSVREVKVPSLFVAYSEEEELKAIVTSDGAHVESSIPRVYMYLNAVLESGERGTLQRFMEFGGSGGFEVFESWGVEERLADEIQRLEKVLLHGVAPPSEPLDVVLGSEVVGLIVHESAGHPMEADRVWGREAAQAGESFVKPDMVGTWRVGNEHATVIDDPTIPGSLGFYLYDDEGVPARPRYIYNRGVLNEMLHTRVTARIYGVKSNAAARSMDYASEPIPRMANTYLEPGDYRFEELIEDVRLGIYVRSYMEWNIDDVRWGQRYVGLEAYM